MEIRTLRTEGLGDSTYVLEHEGAAIVVDPQRDIDRVETLFLGLELRAVIETHVHNDYISGGRDLAIRHGAELIFPAGAAPVFRHRPAFHLEAIEIGDLSVTPLHTPGHTPEHLSYQVKLEDRSIALFSGGSLLVGSAGRSDLLGEERAESLARLQYRSVNRLAALPGETALYPTHGAGSFCTASAAGADVSTIEAERRTNPVLAYEDEDAFVLGQLTGLVPFPSYYAYMGPANIAGRPAVTVFDFDTIEEVGFDSLPGETIVVDARPTEEFAAGHLPGSMGIRLRDDFGVWCGWVLPFDVPIVLVANPDQDVVEAIRQLARIGFDRFVGVIFDLARWERRLETFPTVDAKAFVEAISTGEQILDARAPNEWESLSIEGAIHSYVPDLVSGQPTGLEMDRPVWVLCGSGYRAAIAASLLEPRGFTPFVLSRGGVTDVLTQLSDKGA